MPAVPAIIMGGAAIAGGIGGGLISAGGAKSAAKTQATAAENALAFQKEAYQTQQQQIAPYLAKGTEALNALMLRMPELTEGFDPTKYGVPTTFDYTAKDFTVDPGYEFALQQGQEAIQRSAAAKGGLVSGGTLKDLTAFTTGQAAQQYNSAYARALARYQQNYSNLFNTYETNQQNAYNRLSTLAGMGLSATRQSGEAAQNFANQSGTYGINAGNALAAGEVGSANAWTSALGQIVNAITGGYQMFKNQQYQQGLANALAASGTSTGSVNI